MITSDGIIIRTDTEEISMFGRVTQGVKVMKLADDVKVVSIAKAKKEDEEEVAEESETSEEAPVETSEN